MAKIGGLISVLLAFLAIPAGAFASVKITVREVVEEKPIPFSVRYEFSRAVGPGRVVRVRTGIPGAERRIFRVTLRDGVEIARELVREERIAPVDALFHMGRAGHPTDRGSFKRAQVRMMEATAYDPSAGRRNPTFRTSSGLPARYGVVAVDPREIPIGTLLFVEGYGFAIAADTGSAVRGNRIDLCVPTRAEALRFGRRMVRVHIFRDRKPIGGS